MDSMSSRNLTSRNCARNHHTHHHVHGFDFPNRVLLAFERNAHGMRLWNGCWDAENWKVLDGHPAIHSSQPKRGAFLFVLSADAVAGLAHSDTANRMRRKLGIRNEKAAH